MPTTATNWGAYSAASWVRRVAPARSSAGVSSSARAVALGTTLVMPRPELRSVYCSSGRRWWGVKPDRWRVGQNRLPGLAKWWPVAAEYRPGLMPQKSTARPGAITSGMVRLRAADSSSGVNRGTWTILHEGQVLAVGVGEECHPEFA